MRHVLIASLMLAGCLQATDDFSDGRSSQPTTLAPGRTTADAGVTASDPTDPAKPAQPPPAAYDWLGDVGPSHPELFVSMSGWAQVGDCPGSACMDFVDLDASCVFGLQVSNTRYTATLSDTDCTALKRWFTSDVLLAGLRSYCAGLSGDESLIVEATDPAYSARKKFHDCPGEPFVSHRACLAAIRAKYFPGK